MLMRSFFKFRQLASSNSTSYILRFHVSKFQILHLSLLSKPSEPPSNRTEETQLKDKKNHQKEAFTTLFHEITGILGTEDIISDVKNPSGFPISNTEATYLSNCEVGDSTSACLPPVCKNVNLEKDNLSCSEDTQLSESFVSSIVNKVTEIVRGDCDGLSMEKCLESASFELDLVVVDNVLKRCFKVPQLALRFFNWVKVRDGFIHTTETYNTMIYISGEAKDFRAVEELVEEMEKNSCEKNIKTWTILVMHYGKAKLISKALLVFEKMRKSGIQPDEVIYKLMVRSLCIAKKAVIAMEFYKEMVNKEFSVDVNLYKLLFKCLAQHGDTALIHLVADDMIQIAHIPDHYVYSCVLKSFCISGRIKEALELIRDLKKTNVTLDPEHFETLVKGLCRSERISDAVEIVDIMKKRNIVDATIYGHLVHGYLRRNDVSKAFEVFEIIKVSGYSPTISTYTELIQHSFRLNGFQKASELYKEMLETGVKLDVVGMTALIAGFVSQNQISDAWVVFDGMKEKGIKANKKCYTIFIRELCKVSKTNEVIKVLSEMQAANVKIGDDLFRHIISYLDKSREIEIIEVVKNMQRDSELYYPQEIEPYLSHCEESKSTQIEKQGLELDLLNSYSDSDLVEICGILSSSEDWYIKHEALEKSNVKFTPQLVVEILRNCQCLWIGAALRFFSWVGARPGFTHTTEMYNIAIKISGQVKDFKHMRRLFYEMRRKGCSVTADTWTIMITQYGQTGLTEIALKIFKEMKSAGGCSPDWSTYKSLITSLCGSKGRKVNEAIQTFTEMIRVGIVPDKKLAETYLACLCEDGKVVNARDCVATLKKVGFSLPLSYSLYIRALCRYGRVEEALALLNEVGEAEQSTIVALNQYIYGSLVHALLRKRRVESAMTKIESMMEVGITPTVHVYTSLIVYFFKEKEMGKAISIFDRMKNEGCEPTVVTYSALIRGYMSMGKMSEAWGVFCHMKKKGPSPDFKTYSMFISCLCEVQKSKEALKLISEMLDSGITPSTVNFRTVIHGLNREGEQNLATSVLQMKLDLKSRRMFLTQVSPSIYS